MHGPMSISLNGARLSDGTRSPCAPSVRADTCHRSISSPDVSELPTCVLLRQLSLFHSFYLHSISETVAEEVPVQQFYPECVYV